MMRIGPLRRVLLASKSNLPKWLRSWLTQNSVWNAERLARKAKAAATKSRTMADAAVDFETETRGENHDYQDCI